MSKYLVICKKCGRESTYCYWDHGLSHFECTYCDIKFYNLIKQNDYCDD